MGYPTDTIETIHPNALEKILAMDDTVVLDSRRRSEFDAEHVVGSEILTLDSIGNSDPNLDPSKNYYMYCVSGYRSATLISILRKMGYRNIKNILGGFEAIRETEIPITEYVCPTTML